MHLCAPSTGGTRSDDRTSRRCARRNDPWIDALASPDLIFRVDERSHGRESGSEGERQPASLPVVQEPHAEHEQRRHCRSDAASMVWMPRCHATSRRRTHKRKAGVVRVRVACFGWRGRSDPVPDSGRRGDQLVHRALIVEVSDGAPGREVDCGARGARLAPQDALHPSHARPAGFCRRRQFPPGASPPGPRFSGRGAMGGAMRISRRRDVCRAAVGARQRRRSITRMTSS